MAATGGPIQEVSIRGRVFSVAESAEASLKLGGYENELGMNGDGSARILKTRVPWMTGGLEVQIDHDRSDQQFLKSIADSSDYVAMSVTLVTGNVYMGRGQITGEVAVNTKQSTASLTLSGPGEQEKQ